MERYGRNHPMYRVAWHWGVGVIPDDFGDTFHIFYLPTTIH